MIHDWELVSINNKNRQDFVIRYKSPNCGECEYSGRIISARCYNETLEILDEHNITIYLARDKYREVSETIKNMFNFYMPSYSVIEFIINNSPLFKTYKIKQTTNDLFKYIKTLGSEDLFYELDYKTLTLIRDKFDELFESFSRTDKKVIGIHIASPLHDCDDLTDNFKIAFFNIFQIDRMKKRNVILNEVMTNNIFVELNNRVKYTEFKNGKYTIKNEEQSSENKTFISFLTIQKNY